jgi:hypothetical protein
MINLHENGSVSRTTNSGCILGNSVQHRLDIRRRTGDHTKNLTRGSLLLRGLSELPSKRLVLF